MRKFHRSIAIFKGKKVGVIGDILVDHYIFGSADRISQEAPTPIVRVTEEKLLPGGAANAAANIAALGGVPTLIGVVGNDEKGAWVRKELERRGIEARLLADPSRRTTEKIRIMAMNQQLLRIDREDPHYLSRSLEKECIERMRAGIQEWSAVLISDYAKGMITPRIAAEAVKLSRTHRKPVIVNAKPKHFSFFTGATLLTPNKKEAEGVLMRTLATEGDIQSAGKALQKRFRSPVLITRGADGMTLFEGVRITHFPALAREVYDVTGASDTVVAALALSVAAEANLSDAAHIANHAAGLAVGKVGTATVSIEELRASILSYGNQM